MRRTDQGKRWYFDVVSTTSKNESIDIVFYNAGPNGFPGGYQDGPLSVGVSGSFANGSIFDYQVSANTTVITEDSKGMIGDWKGTGALFRGSNLRKRHVSYVIKLDSPELGVVGSVTLHSVRTYTPPPTRGSVPH